MMTELDSRWEWHRTQAFGMRDRYVRSRCKHLEVVPVDSIVTGETLAWLCVTCDEQLAQRPESAYCTFTNAEQQRFDSLAAQYDVTSDAGKRAVIRAELKALVDRRY